MSINSKLCVAILPIDIIDNDKAANLQSLAAGMSRMPDGIDFVVIPELFSTGFTNDASVADDMAEPIDGETITTVSRLAAEHKTAFCGSYLAKDGDNLFNRGFIIEPGGETTFYDKRHLFSLSDEAKIYTRGDRLPPVVRYRGWNISMAVCYDLRFPAWLRNPQNKYDVMAIPANWPESRSFAWTHLLQGRAIENTSYVIGANRSGEDRYGKYDGLSQIYDFMGHPIGKTAEDGQIITATLEKSLQEIQRQRFPVWCDADDFKFVD